MRPFTTTCGVQTWLWNSSITTGWSRSAVPTDPAAAMTTPSAKAVMVVADLGNMAFGS